MNFKKLDTAKWLVPVLAVLIIIESVFIVQKLSQNKDQGWQTDGDKLEKSLQPKSSKQTTLTLVGDTTLEEGMQGELSVVMTPYKQLSLDGADILLEYDPDYIKVLGTDPSDRFSRVGRNWIEPEKKRVLVSLIQLDQTVDFEAGKEATLLTLQFEAKKKGNSSVSIVKTDKASTKLVGQGDEHDFSSEDVKLMIK